MKFGKLTDISEVDFYVPRLSVLRKSTNLTALPKIYLGTTGWSNKAWVGEFYPEKAKSSEYLKHYANLFNTIELNTTHYHIPDAKRVSNWCSQVNDDFLFCPKVPQIISHRSNIASETTQTKSFFDAVQLMKKNLGVCFMQLSEHFDPSQSDKLLHFLARKPKDIKFSIELRHKKWFENDNQNLKFLSDSIAGLNTSLVITDVAGRRDVCHSQVAQPCLLLRLVGNNQRSSDFARIEQWVNRIQEVQYELDEIFIFFHQPEMSAIPEMVNFFIKCADKVGIKESIRPIQSLSNKNLQLRLF